MVTIYRDKLFQYQIVKTDGEKIEYKKNSAETLPLAFSGTLLIMEKTKKKNETYGLTFALVCSSNFDKSGSNAAVDESRFKGSGLVEKEFLKKKKKIKPQLKC